jgi:hypothetical protein
MNSYRAYVLSVPTTTIYAPRMVFRWWWWMSFKEKKGEEGKREKKKKGCVKKSESVDAFGWYIIDIKQ